MPITYHIGVVEGVLCRPGWLPITYPIGVVEGVLCRPGWLPRCFPTVQIPHLNYGAWTKMLHVDSSFVHCLVRSWIVEMLANDVFSSSFVMFKVLS